MCHVLRIFTISMERRMLNSTEVIRTSGINRLEHEVQSQKYMIAPLYTNGHCPFLKHFSGALRNTSASMYSSLRHLWPAGGICEAPFDARHVAFCPIQAVGHFAALAPACCCVQPSSRPKRSIAIAASTLIYVSDSILV